LQKNNNKTNTWKKSPSNYQKALVQQYAYRETKDISQTKEYKLEILEFV